MAVPACTSEQAVTRNAEIEGSDAFVVLIEDARIAVRDNDLVAAGRLYDEARALEPENSGLWVDIARLRFRGGEHLIAVEAADYALELEPQSAPALLLRAQLVRDAYGLDASLVWFEAAIEADPVNPEPLAEYAATLGDLGRYSEMLEAVRKLAKMAPDHPQVHFLQAVLAARGEDLVLAKNLLNRSGLSRSGVPAAMLLDAIIDIQQENFGTAADTLGVLSRRQPANERVSDLLARALWLGGRDRELIEQFESHALRPGASPYLIMLVGRSFERMGNRAKGIEFISSARNARWDGLIVLDSAGIERQTLPKATAQLRELVTSNDAAQAQVLSEQLRERAPYSADFLSLTGDVALARGDTLQALEHYEAAAKVRRSWPLTRKIIHAYRLLGDDRAAQVLLSKTIAGDPQNSDALLVLAQLSAQQEDWLRVSVLLDTAIELGAGNDIEVLSLTAEAKRALGEVDRAEHFEAIRARLAPSEFIAG